MRLRAGFGAAKPLTPHTLGESRATGFGGANALPDWSIVPPDAQLETDTIVAIATPAGRGGIGVVRLSGPASLAIAQRLVTLRTAPESRRAHYGVVVTADGARLDDAVVTWFAGPRSYTGEDVVEVSTHGSPVVLHAVLGLAMAYGARMARPGEFTERAFLHGRLNLVEAEAVRDLIDAQSVGQARLASRQMGGALAREVAPIKRDLLGLMAALNAGIDFAEDDLDTLSDASIAERVERLLVPLRMLEGSFARSRPLREGLKLAIVGKPNSGKSSLFNGLLGRDRAIVTAVAGTTRDSLSEHVVLGDVPVQLVDTAGIRETDDEVERLGVERTWEAVAEADVLLHVLDATAGPQGWAELAVRGGAPCPVVTILNKADLLSGEERDGLREHMTAAVQRRSIAGDAPGAPPPGSSGWLFTSAKTGEGLPDVQAQILRLTGATATFANTDATVTNARQFTAIQAAVEGLAAALAASRTHTPHEMVLLTLQTGLDALDTLTGETTADAVLELIFSTFCIGK